MQVLDMQHGSVHGPSIAPTANVSATQTGLGVDLAAGDLVGHVHMGYQNYSTSLDVEVQQSDDNGVADPYATTNIFIVTLDGDRGTDEDLGGWAFHLLQFVRHKRWARVVIAAHGTGSITNMRFFAGLSSMLISDGGGSSVSPANS